MKGDPPSFKLSLIGIGGGLTCWAVVLPRLIGGTLGTAVGVACALGAAAAFERLSTVLGKAETVAKTEHDDR